MRQTTRRRLDERERRDTACA